MKTQSNIQKIGKVKRSFSRLSLQWRITFVILLTFIVILPLIALSLFYFTNLIEGITTIIEQDVKLGRIANDLSLTMQDIRRYERNYRMFGNKEEQESVLQSIAHAESVLVSARQISPESEIPILNDLSEYLRIYSNSFDMLVEYITQKPPENSIQQKTKLMKRINDFQSVHRNIIRELNNASPAKRDSILVNANKYLDVFSLDLLALSNQPGQPSNIQENLDIPRQVFLKKSHDLSERSWASMQTHKNESMRVEARAKRNIISVLILSSIMCIFIVLYLPHYIVSPIALLNKILRQAKEGNFTLSAPIQSNDEIGELAANYNQLIEHIHRNDELKTEKIASQKRAFDRLLENVEVPACIVTKDLRATFYNLSFVAIFGSSVPTKAPEGGLKITEIRTMDDFMEDLRKGMVDKGNDFYLDVIDQNGISVKMKGRLVRNALMQLESIILVGIPEKSEESEH